MAQTGAKHPIKRLNKSAGTLSKLALTTCVYFYHLSPFQPVRNLIRALRLRADRRGTFREGKITPIVQ
jgi:hypothetical protein